MRTAPRIISRHSTRDRAELALETMLIARRVSSAATLDHIAGAWCVVTRH